MHGKSLDVRQQLFGPKSEQAINSCKIVSDLCNLLAVMYLQQENYNLVLKLLKKAEVLTKQYAAGRAVTFNNTACYYRKLGKLRTALKYAQRALKIEGRLGNNVEYYPADTYLNACAILSQLGDHHSALDHAQSALISLQDELFKGIEKSNGNECVINGISATHDDDTSSNNQQQLLVKLDRIAVLAIAYHNLGVEQEFLKKYNFCLGSYRKGLEIAQQYLGQTNPTTQTLRKAFNAAENTLAAAKKERKR